MCRREVLDNYLRNRAKDSGAKVLNGLFMGMEQKEGPEGAYTLNFNNYEAGGKVGKPETLEVDLVVGADGANSRVAREIDAGDYDYAIAFQVCFCSLNGVFTSLEACGGDVFNLCDPSSSQRNVLSTSFPEEVILVARP